MTHQNIRKAEIKLVRGLLDLIVLGLLKENSMHGYGIISSIRKSFGIYFGPSTIYPLLTELEKKGHRVHFSTMLFHTDNFYGITAPRLMATLLRTFCQGIKVCVEMTLMACDGGLVASGEKVIAIAGTGAGADTAVVVTSAPTNKLGELRIHEIICKPL